MPTFSGTVRVKTFTKLGVAFISLMQLAVKLHLVKEPAASLFATKHIGSLVFIRVGSGGWERMSSYDARQAKRATE